MPKNTPTKSQPDDLKRSIGISVLLHGVLISLFAIRSLFFSEPLIDLSQAITVSVGELPDNNRLPPKAQPAQSVAKEEPTPPQPEPAAPVEPEPAPKPVAKPEPTPPAKETAKVEPDKTKMPPKNVAKEDEVNLEKSRARQREALNRLKTQSALEKIRQDVKNESATRVRNSNAAPMPTRVIAAGSALSGLDQLHANDYLSAVDRNIKQVWTLPQWLMNKPYKTQILVKISTQGQILSTDIISSSGNSSYDQYCLEAVEKAAPFPQVPDKLSEKFRVDGIVIGFPE